MASKKDKYLESAQRFALKGQLDKAIKDYQAVVAMEPNEIRYRQKLAELLVKDNRKEEAIAQYADIGKHYADNSYFLKAIAVYKTMQKLSPGNTDISLTLASLNHKQGLNGNALAEYGQVLAQLEKGREYKAAVKVVEQMLEVDREHVPTRLRHAELLFGSGKKDASYEAFNALVNSLRGRGDAASAERVSQRMAELFPGEQQQSLEQLADVIAGGHLDEAIRALRQWLKGDPRDRQAWQLLCTAQRRKGDTSGLRESYEKMMEVYPDDPGILKAAIRSEVEAGDAGAALGLLECHVPRLLQRGQTVPSDDLLQLFPAHLAEQYRVTEWLQHFYHASSTGNAGTVSSVAPPEVIEPPDAFASSAMELELSLDAAAEETAPAPDYAATPDLPWDSQEEEAAASAEVQGEDIPLPWEEEIELNLDDDAPAELPSYGEMDLPLDFSMTAGEEEPASPFAAPAPEAVAPSGDLSFLSEDLTADGGEEFPREAEGEEPAFDADGGGELLLDIEETQVELTLPGDPEEFPDFAWGQEDDAAPAAEAESPAEIAAGQDFLGDAGQVSQEAAGQQVEHLEEAEPVEELQIVEPRGWEEIYPEAVGAAADIDELESHYDLGIGYKEMGMYDGAIRELALAAGNPQRRLACLALQAICYREKGDTGKAQDLLQRGLELDVLSGEERRTLSYELAYLYESTGAVDQAITLYRDVYRADPGFNDVAARLFHLSGEEPADVIDLELEEAEL